MKTIDAHQLMWMVLEPPISSECLVDEGTSLRSSVVKIWLTTEPPDPRYRGSTDRCWFQLKNGQVNWIGFHEDLLLKNLQKLLACGIEVQDDRH